MHFYVSVLLFYYIKSKTFLHSIVKMQFQLTLGFAILFGLCLPYQPITLNEIRFADICVDICVLFVAKFDSLSQFEKLSAKCHLDCDRDRHTDEVRMRSFGLTPYLPLTPLLPIAHSLLCHLRIPRLDS